MGEILQCILHFPILMEFNSTLGLLVGKFRAEGCLLYFHPFSLGDQSLNILNALFVVGQKRATSPLVISGGSFQNHNSVKITKIKKGNREAWPRVHLRVSRMHLSLIMSVT
jgi:hypothetical protein